jgi:hypothetical protein
VSILHSLFLNLLLRRHYGTRRTAYALIETEIQPTQARTKIRDQSALFRDHDFADPPILKQREQAAEQRQQTHHCPG